MVQVLQDAQAAHPDIVKVSSIGKSAEGRDIWVVKVSDNVAVDEPEPEVMFDSLHHAREHLSLEQSLAILRWLTDGYGSDARITKIVDSREIWIIPSVNPDGAEWDLTGDPYREWRKNRQVNAGSVHKGTDLNRNYGYHWACCGGSSGSTASETYHGRTAFSAPETRAMRDFMLSRRVDGQQQIELAITFHTAGEEILWPYGYTKTDIPWDMTKDDHAALAALGKRMATRNDYTPKQSSSLYVTDGDEIDWAYGSQRIWMYTFELYPTHAKVSSIKRFYPADELIARETERNKDAILYFIEHAGCRYSVIGKTTTHCGPMFEDFETPNGWTANPLGTDTATSGTWQRGNPDHTPWQAGTVPREPAPWSPARPRAHRPRRTTSTAGSRRSGPRRSPCRRRRARSRSSTTSPTPATRRRTTRSGPMWNGMTARGRSFVRNSAHPTPTSRHGRRSRCRWRRGPVRPSGSCSRRPTWLAPAWSKLPSTTSGSLARRTGKADAERGPATDRGLDGDRAAVGLDQAPRDR